MNRLRSRAIAFASSAAFALVLASALASADGIDSDQDGVSDDLEGRTQRTIAGTATGDRFDVSSHLGTDGVQDQFEFSYWPGHFGVWYGVKDGPSVNYSVELSNLFEWVDEDGDNRLSAGEIRQGSPLGSTGFTGSAVDPSEQRDADAGRALTFTIDSQDRQVSMIIKVAQRFTRFQDVTLTPMEARMEIQINRVLSDPSARVGLEFRLRASSDAQVRVENRSWDEMKQWAPSERAINVTQSEGGRSASAFFTWATSAVVSALPGTVTHTSQFLAWNDYRLYFAYPPGTSQVPLSVVHQTAFGVRSAAFDSREAVTLLPPEVQGDLFLFTASFAAVAGVVALTAFRSNRRRVRRVEKNRKP